MSASTTAQAVKFKSAFEAYCWARAIDRVISATGRVPELSIERPCTHTQILDAISLLRASGRLALQHIRCLDIWCQQNMEPTDPEPRAVFLEATEILSWPFQNKGWME